LVILGTFLKVFRKDLISAMKIPDTSQLLTEEYWVMQDTWRMEWEKGVQVSITGMHASCAVQLVGSVPLNVSKNAQLAV